MGNNSDKHFMPCMNESCNTYHLVSQQEIEQISNGNNSIDTLLCDDCKLMQNKFHVIQCLSCKTIIDFIPSLADEIPSVIYVEKCLRCGGSVEDEIEFMSSIFKHLFI